MNSDPLAGFPKDLLPRYDKISHLARGGMGVLFRAHDKRLDKDVAIKALPSRSLLGVEKVVRFQKEAKAAGRLDHQSIVKVLDFGVTQSGDPYLIMDFIDGPSLEQSIREDGTPDLATALMYFVQIADGLSHAHKNGIVHRDIKPNNIMLGDSEKGTREAKIVDFGIAHMKRTESEDSGFESTGGNIIGSPGYVSPEVVSGGKADQRSDIYSMGCLMFETLAGRLPFQGETALETIRHHVNTPTPEIIEWLSQEEDEELALAMAKVVMRCLSKKPTDRYQSADELKHELFECAQMLDEDVRAVFISEDINSGGTFKSWSLLRPGVNQFKVPRLVQVLLWILSISVVLIGGPKAWMDITGGAPKVTKLADNTEAPLIPPLYEVDAVVTITEKEIEKRLKHGKVEIRSAIITDKAMRKLLTLPVVALDMSGSQMSKETLARIRGLKGLNLLSLEQMPDHLTDKDLDTILPPLKQLTGLSISGSLITDESLAKIAKMKQLEVLSLGNCLNVTNTGVAQLKALPELRTFTIGGTKVSPASVNGFPRLKDLNVDFKNISNEEMTVISRVPGLKQLSVTNCSIDRDGFFMLLNCPNLARVQIALVTTISKQDMKDFNRQFRKRYGRDVLFKTDWPYGL